MGITPKLSDAELVTLAVMQALLGHTFAAAGWAIASDTALWTDDVGSWTPPRCSLAAPGRPPGAVGASRLAALWPVCQALRSFWGCGCI